jgi:methionyl-tRNA formyltransferase
MINKPLGRVLYFGGQNCEGSLQVAEYLLDYADHIEIVYSANRNEPLPQKILEWEGDYIVCFRSYHILTKQILDKAKIAAINFHPGSPKYPGSGAASWALYNNDSMFGVTAHIINELIDNGAIIDVLEFPIDSEDNIEILSDRSKDMLYRLFLNVFDKIVEDKTYLQTAIQTNTYKWQGKAKKIAAINNLQKIDMTVDKTELDRIIRATSIGKFTPYLELHGYKFRLQNEYKI